MIIILNTNVGYLYANGGKENYLLSFRTKHGFTWGDGASPPTPPRFSNTKLPCTEVGQNLEKNGQN